MWWLPRVLVVIVWRIVGSIVGIISLHMHLLRVHVRRITAIRHMWLRCRDSRAASPATAVR